MTFPGDPPDCPSPGLQVGGRARITFVYVRRFRLSYLLTAVVGGNSRQLTLQGGEANINMANTKKEEVRNMQKKYARKKNEE